MFDREKEFNGLMKPKMEELAGICRAYGIPVFLSACYRDNGRESIYYNNAVLGPSVGVVLSKDYFPHYVNVQNGFRTVFPYGEKMEYEGDLFGELPQEGLEAVGASKHEEKIFTSPET